MLDWSWETWLIITIVLVLFELLSMDFVFVMLAGGAGIGAIAAGLNLPGLLVWLLAIAGAAAGIGIVRPRVAERIHRGPELRVGPAALIGASAVVLEDVVPHHPGRVKIGGDEWSALPFAGDGTLPAGAQVEVIEIKGAIAYVAPRGDNG